MVNNSSQKLRSGNRKSITRRTALMSAGGIIGAVGLGLTSNTAKADYIAPPGGGGSSDPEKTWSDTEVGFDEDFNYEYRGVLSGALDYYGATQIDTGEWAHTFYASSTTVMHRKRTWESDSYSQHDDISRTRIRIESNDTDRHWIAASEFNTDVGVDPAPGVGDEKGDSDYGSAVYTVVSTALSELNDKVNYGATAFEIVDALIPERNMGDDNEDIREFDWPYDLGDEVEAVHNYAQFLIINNDYHSTTDFDIHFEANSGGDSVINLDRYRGKSVNFTVNVDANDYN